MRKQKIARATQWLPWPIQHNAVWTFNWNLLSTMSVRPFACPLPSFLSATRSLTKKQWRPILRSNLSNRHLLPFILCCCRVLWVIICHRRMWSMERCSQRFFFHALTSTQKDDHREPGLTPRWASFHLCRPLMLIDSDPLSKPVVFEEFDTPLRGR